MVAKQEETVVVMVATVVGTMVVVPVEEAEEVLAMAMVAAVNKTSRKKMPAL
jgi:hypothetical protein